MTNTVKSIIFCFPQLVTSVCFAQAIDNTAIYRSINNKSYTRLHYDNDFFAAKDMYYTQGINLEVVNYGLRKNPLTKILFCSKANILQYGIAIVHEGYTPTSIRHEEIIIGDRPFAADLCLNTFVITTDTLKNRRITSAISTGVIGTLAGGADMQKSIHRWLNNIAPLGWEHQIKNDVVLNYQVCYQQSLIFFRNIFSLNSEVNIRLGTLSDKAGLGFTMMLGYFDSPFQCFDKTKKFRVYFYEQPLVSLIGYDATLQGGLFNRSSPYVIPGDDITRITFQDNFGIVIKIKKLYLEYSHAFLSEEFYNGGEHSWGGIRIGCAFN